MSAGNPFGRSAFEQAEHDRHIYLNTGALRNRLDIHDPQLLELAERHLVAERLREGLPKAARDLTYDGFKAIHRHLYQDVYDWAGVERTYTTGRGPFPFARPEFIASFMEEQFKSLKVQDNLKGFGKTEFANNAAILINEINAAHPFIDGNGRTQRVWLRHVAENAGHHLVLQSADATRWNDASRIGFERSDPDPMAGLIEDGLLERNREHIRRKNRSR